MGKWELRARPICCGVDYVQTLGAEIPDAGRPAMALTVKYENRKDYLYAFVEGEYDFESTVQSYIGILGAGAERHVNKVLIDAMTVTGGPTDFERYDIVSAVIRKYYELIHSPDYVICRFAMVGKAPLLDAKHFCETVATNRGLIIKDVETMAEAFEWLGLKPETAS